MLRPIPVWTDPRLPEEALVLQFRVSCVSVCIALSSLLAAPTTAISQSLDAVSWLADGNSFWFAQPEGEETVAYLVDPVRNELRRLFEVSELEEKLIAALGEATARREVSFELLSVVDNEAGVFELKSGDDRFRLRLDGLELSRIDRAPVERPPTVHPRVVKRWRWSWPDVMEISSPDGRWLLGVDGNDLQIRSTADGKTVALTTDGEKGVEWLLGFEQGTGSGKFSRDGNRVAVVRADMRRVPRTPIQYYQEPSGVEWVRSPKPGDPAPRFELFIIDILSGRRVCVEYESRDGDRIDIVGWRADGSELLFHRRDPTTGVELLGADPATGTTRSLVAEDTRGWFVTFVAGDTRFIWASERDGWTHFYLYDINGQLIRQLTDGASPILTGGHNWVWQNGFVALDEAEGWVYVRMQGNPERPYDAQLYRIRLDGLGSERLTSAPGFHDIQLSPSKGYFVDTYSTVNRAPVTELRRVDGTHLRTLYAEVDVESQTPAPQEFVVKAADGTTNLHGALFFPPQFDPSLSYPVIEWIYAGPWSTVTPRRFDDVTAAEARWLAGLGAVVFIVDGRGTPGRDRKFQDVVVGSLGQHEIPDHAAVLRQLAAEREYMDTTRVGVLGGSWGGYFTIRAMLLAPEIYRVGVAFAPVGDPADYWADYVVPYLGEPEDNPRVYESASNVALAANLAGPLLIMHGTGDVEAPFSGTMKLVAALVSQKKDVDLVVLPDEGHYILSGQHSTYLKARIERHFKDHLGL